MKKKQPHRYMIYVVKNKINDKIYIGKTWQTLPKRLQGHFQDAREGSKRDLMVAIREFGEENFWIEELYPCESAEEMKEMEIVLILKFESHIRGYNMVVWNTLGEMQEISCQRISKGRKEYLKNLAEEEKEEWKAKISLGMQKYHKKKAILGVELGKNNRMPRMKIKCRGVWYRKSWPTVKECQICYDKFALFLHGKGCALNFPELEEEYLKEDLEKFFQEITRDNSTSKFIGVYLPSNKKNFTGRAKIHGISYHIIETPYEIEAALIYDKFYYWKTGLKDKCNFPELLSEISQEEMGKLYYEKRKNIYTRETTSQYFGVSRSSTRLGWMAQKTVNKKCYNKHFTYEIDAAKFYDIIHFLSGDNLLDLNFPDKIEEYKTKTWNDVYQILDKKIFRPNYPEDEKLKELASQHTLLELSEILNIPSKTLSGCLQRKKIKPLPRKLKYKPIKLHEINPDFRKVPHPNARKRCPIEREELESLIWEKSMNKIAESFNVSFNCVAKWCEDYKITRPNFSHTYWAKVYAGKIERIEKPT